MDGGYGGEGVSEPTPGFILLNGAFFSSMQSIVPAVCDVLSALDLAQWGVVG